MRKLAVLVAMLFALVVPPADAGDDYGGGPAVWNTSSVPVTQRTADGCRPVEFNVRIEAPVFTIEADDYRYTGPLMLAGVGGTWPCWWGDSGGWFEVREPVLGCEFVGGWFSFPLLEESETLHMSLYGTCGPKQVDLFAAMTFTEPGRAAGTLLVTNCH